MENAVETEITIEKVGQGETMLFTCPVCGSNELEQVETSVTAHSPVVVCADGYVTVGKTYFDFEDVEEISYQCAHCPYELEIDFDIVRDEDDLVQWLRNHNGDQQQPESVE